MCVCVNPERLLLDDGHEHANNCFRSLICSRLSEPRKVTVR